jgi:DNA polymerase
MSRPLVPPEEHLIAASTVKLGGGDVLLARLRADAAGCRACDLWERATQTVFGAGPASADVMLVGEQPGDREDLAGAPFVGPAGRILDAALAQAGIDRARVYVTNTVKHFKWEPRGKRRLHARPNQAEVGACRPWLEREIAAVRPRVIVCLGATAARSLLGPGYRVKATQERGKAHTSALAQYVVATIHPSAILRVRDSDARRTEMATFVKDLTAVAKLLTDDGKRTA